MSKVVSICGEPVIPPGEPNPRIIEELERLLARAKSGDVIGIAFVEIEKTFTYRTNWGIEGGQAATNAMFAGLATLSWRLGQATTHNGTAE
jgi:hypothetical protein